MVWLKFLLCIILVLFAGTKATRYADVIAEKTGLGRVWIGLLFLGMVTSMPELITGVSSVTLLGEAGIPDLGLGTLLGSCIFNLSILAVLDVLYRDGPVLNQASMRQIASAGIGIQSWWVESWNWPKKRITDPPWSWEDNPRITS